MFAYCLNNPVNGADSSGSSYEAVQPDMYGGSIPIPPVDLGELFKNILVSIGILGAADVLLSNSTVGIRAQTNTREETKAIEKPIPIYYGCRINDGQFIFKTEPMLYWQAYIWALTRREDSTIGKRTSWGLYTVSADDAYSMALALGCRAEPIWHAGHQDGYLNHYHVSGYDFLHFYKHFHVWYG